MSKEKVLVVDDDSAVRYTLMEALRGWNYEPFEAATIATALELFDAEHPSAVLQDINLPDGSGLDALVEYKKRQPQAIVIMITGNVQLDDTITALRGGAHDFISKPVRLSELQVTIRNGIETGKLRREVQQLRRQQEQRFSFAQIIGQSQATKEMIALACKVAASEASSVLLQGESGTGKDLVAKAIHYSSARAERPFIAINCAAIPATLIESELFGHEKGAFTDARARKEGLFEQAQGGTLFLDEIGELPLALQSKLLRALQEREITRVGSVENIAVDIRVVAATNRSLSTAVQNGEFREDLYYRLNVLNIRMPALRKRTADIPMLVENFLREFRERDGLRQELKIAPDVMQKLMAMEWPGNVRELRNYIERLTVLSDGPTITMTVLTDLSTNESQTFKAIRTIPGAGVTPPRDPKEISDVVDFRHARDRFEAEYIKKVLRSCGGNVSEAAKKSGMSRRNFYEKIEKLGIDPSEYKGGEKN